MRHRPGLGENVTVVWVGILIGATAALLLIRLAVPGKIREDPKWAVVLVAAMTLAAFAGGWVASVIA
jgi:hypothetical protein